ncbi:hypothetical protein PMAYCL1PPCAC_23549 [Pristionchus mayeri]|uniref:Peptidylglycine monooxygenase n=1 Tax=Pristionchus mayeri TaxID=1317129 RepID=A0AAN5I6K7_9BILA|nr:hypothetical protein PMAYCL1PPCAC_23549 [Pristionchus mayeri]
MREALFSLYFLFCTVNFFVDAVSVARKPQTIKKWTIQMVGYAPMKNDDYVAVSMEAPTGYIVGYEPLADADRVHHMLLYGCTRPYAESGFWRGESTCGGGGAHILYAWARNAPNLELPKGVGFAIGDSSGESGIKYLVLQVHYAAPFAGNVRDYSGVTLKVAAEEPPNLAAVYLLFSRLPIPPGQPAFQNNMSCTYPSRTVLHPFAFRTHTHKMGRLVSAFYKRNGQWTMVGKRNPQWPQLFEDISRPLEIHQGDFIAGSCRFDSSDTTKVTPMGSMGSNEMCNFYMMVYYKASDENPFPYGAYCSQQSEPHSFDDYPKEGTELLPPRPELEHHAHQSTVPFGVIEEAKFSSIGNVPLGQVSGLSFDPSHNLVIFHRGKRAWNQNTFNGANELNDKTPIDDDVILISKMEGKNASLVARTGKGLFYLPHGIFVDSDNSIYTTDVGSHTVAKWKLNADSSLSRVWEAGTPLTPGSGSTHFCKPTGVVVKGGSIFVSDGYCNDRVVELTLEGKYRSEFKGTGGFRIPHDIVSNGETHNLFVADRENGRVHELRSDGSEVSIFTSGLFNNIYSVDTNKDNVFMIPGEFRATQFGGEELPLAVFVGRSGTGLTQFAFAPTSGPFSRPHIVRVCPHGDHVYVGDITEASPLIWKFKIQHEGSNHETDGGTVSFLSSLSLPYTPHVSSGYSFLVFFLFIAFLLGSAVWAKKKLSSSSPQSTFSRTGFKPLRMEDNLGVSSDESDLD